MRSDFSLSICTFSSFYISSGLKSLGRNPYNVAKLCVEAMEFFFLKVSLKALARFLLTLYRDYVSF